MDANYRKTLILLLLFLITGILVYRDAGSLQEDDAVPIVKDIPVTLGPWRGTDLPYNTRVFDNVLGADATIFREYQDINSSRAVQIYVAYYRTMEKSDLAHSPLVCYAGQGWEITERDTHEIPLAAHNTILRSTRLMLQNGNHQEIVLFWYQVGKKTFPTNTGQRMLLIFNKLLHRGQENIWVRVSIPVRDQEVERALRTEDDFLADLYSATLGIFSN